MERKATISAARCVLCGAPVRSRDGRQPCPVLYENALICDNHAEQQLERDGFVGLYGDTSSEYIDRIAEMSRQISGKAINTAWYRPCWFSLLFQFAGGDLLLIYPNRRAAMALYVPVHLRVPEVPLGLPILDRNALLYAQGPFDEDRPKPGLELLVDLAEGRIPLRSIGFDTYTETGLLDPEVLIVWFESGDALRVNAVGAAFTPTGDVDAIDLQLRWLKKTHA